MKINSKTSLSSYNNEWYSTQANYLKRFLWYFTNVLIFINPLMPFSKFKVTTLRIFGATVGKGVVIKPCVNIKYPWNLEIGNHAWVGEKVWIDNLANVVIGPNVCLSQGATLLCGNHNYKKTTFDLMVGEIYLEEGSWIGAQGIVCPGVTCKSHAILTAGSVASKDLEPYSIYSGNPAEKIRNRIIE